MAAPGTYRFVWVVSSRDRKVIYKSSEFLIVRKAQEAAKP
jgi:hypothetical protein